MSQSASAAIAKRRPNSAFQNLMSLHWWMAVAYLILFVGGTFMSQLPCDVAIRPALYDFYKSIGILTVGLLLARVLLLLRVWWRKYTRRLPQLSARWWRLFLLHTSLYLFMIVVPTTGVFLSNSFKAGNVKFFGLVVPDIFPENSSAVDLGRNLHFWLSYSFLVFVIAHALDQRKVVRALWRRFMNVLHKRQAKPTSES